MLDEHPEAGLCTPAHRVIDETGAFVKMSYEPPGLASSDLETRLRAHMWRIGRLTLYGLWRRDVLERIGPPLPIWGSDVVLVWRALLVGPVQTIPRPLNDYRVFREKTVDTTMFGLTATSRAPTLPTHGFATTFCGRVTAWVFPRTSWPRPSTYCGGGR